ncbi:MAG TPA: hypothetical protein PKD37_07530 [Oligoflexia bacterium]|nr:hypothetical protein [Oligoflexia bacterium]
MAFRESFDRVGVIRFMPKTDPLKNEVFKRQRQIPAPLPNKLQTNNEQKNFLLKLLASTVFAVTLPPAPMEGAFVKNDCDRSTNPLGARVDNSRQNITKGNQPTIPTRAEIEIANHLKKASLKALSGDANEVRFYVREALARARKAGVKIDKESIREMIRVAMINEISVKLIEAEKAAAIGDVCLTKRCISLVEFNCEETKVKLSDEQEKNLKLIVKLANLNAICVNLAKAEEEAKKGLVDEAASFIAQVYRNSQEAEIKLTEKQTEKIKSVFEKAIIMALELASRHASVGDTGKVEELLLKIRSACRKIGVELTPKKIEEMGDIVKLAHAKALVVNLAKAEEKLKFGFTRQAGQLVAMAYKNADKAEIELLEEQKRTIKGIFEKAFLLDFNRALEYAPRGEADFVESLVATMLKVAEDTKVELTQAQKTRINQLVELAHKNAIPMNLFSAEQLAKLGALDEVTDCILAARRSVEKIGIRFSSAEEERMQRIIKLANKNAIPLNLAQAQDLAAAGEVEEMQKYLLKVFENAKTADIEIDENEIKHIVRLGNTEAIDVNLRSALKILEYGDVEQAFSFLMSVANNAQKAGVPFNQNQRQLIAEITNEIFYNLLNKMDNKFIN